MGAIMTIWPQLPLDPEETLLSYAERLSLMQTGRGMERLLADRGIHKEHFISGRVDAVAMLAEATGHTIDDLQRNAIRGLQRGVCFRGEDMWKTFLSPRAARYCPACLIEDGRKADRRHRILWGFRLVSRCDKHGLWLAKAPVTDATSLRIALGVSPLAQADEAIGETPEYLGWLRRRIHGEMRDCSPWLEGQTIEQVLAASEMLGAILEHGHGVAVTRLMPPQTEEATDIGSSIYREGAEAISETLDTIRQTSPATAVQAGPLAYYGNLFDWLDRRSNAINPGPIRDILRDHIVMHSAVEPGTTVLGAKITKRRFHTIYSLSSEVGIGRPRLSRLLRKLGQVPENATEVESGNMVFDAAKTVSLIESFKTAVPLGDVPEYLGASKRQVEVLYRAGIVKPLIPRTGRGSVRHVIFARQHLDDLLVKLYAFPVFSPGAGAKLQPIAYVCQRGAGPFEEVFADILDGRIPSFRDPERSGIGSIYVNANSVLDTKSSS